MSRNVLIRYLGSIAQDKCTACYISVEVLFFVPLLESTAPCDPVMWCQKALRGRMAVGVQG